MMLISGFISVPGSAAERSDSVMLQQASRGGETVLMACVCDEKRGDGRDWQPYAVARLQGWYREAAMELGLAGCSDVRMEKELGTCLRNMDAEREDCGEVSKVGRDMSLTGILVCGARFWLFHRGNTRAYLMNQYFMHPHIRCLTCAEHSAAVKDKQRNGGKEDGRMPDVRSGILQKGTGILLCTDGLYGFAAENRMKECLCPRDISREQQIGKRLGELEQEARRRGCADHISAVYIKVQEGLYGGK